LRGPFFRFDDIHPVLRGFKSGNTPVRPDKALESNWPALLLLEAVRPRSLSAELQARWRLGWILSEQQKTEAAKAAISLHHLQFDETQLDFASAFTLKKHPRSASQALGGAMIRAIFLSHIHSSAREVHERKRQPFGKAGLILLRLEHRFKRL
jgi:hypothetical protein